jgi:hypothetical protein
MRKETILITVLVAMGLIIMPIAGFAAEKSAVDKTGNGATIHASNPGNGSPALNKNNPGKPLQNVRGLHERKHVSKHIVKKSSTIKSTKELIANHP